MLKTTEQLIYELRNYSSPNCKLNRLVKEGVYGRIKQGLYSDDKEPDPRTLATTFVNPSYISFNTALSYHDMIPEYVYSMTCATYSKTKSRYFSFNDTDYHYYDVPSEVYHIGIYFEKVDSGDTYWIATKEKALCDKLYHIEPRDNLSEMNDLILDDLRINEYKLDEMELDLIDELESRYHCKNVTLFKKWIERRNS